MNEATFRFEKNGIYLTGENLGQVVAWHLRHHHIEAVNQKRFRILDSDIIQELYDNLRLIGITIKEVYEKVSDEIKSIMVGNVSFSIGMNRNVRAAVGRCFI